jgi:hypothetical protein
VGKHIAGFRSESGFSWTRPDEFEDLPTFRWPEGRDGWHWQPDKVTLPSAVIQEGGPVEMLLYDQGHDGTLVFTQSAISGMTEAILERLAANPGWGLVAFGRVVDYEVMSIAGRQQEGVREQFLAILAPGGVGEVVIEPGKECEHQYSTYSLAVGD